MPEIALGGFIKTLLAAIAISVAIRGPGAVAHGAPDRARQLMEQLRRDGINITEAEALGVASEPCIGDPVIRAKLQEMATNAENLKPIVEALSRALSIEQAP